MHSKGIFGGGSCLLPLQVTTVIYRLHSNAALGPQRNMVVRGVPATVYDEGRSIELYSGRVAIDVFSDTFAHALAAANELRPLNAPARRRGTCLRRSTAPASRGRSTRSSKRSWTACRAQVCQRTAAAVAFAKSLVARG